jgi:hypothetical protein
MNEEELNRIIRDVINNDMDISNTLTSWMRNYTLYSDNYFMWDIQGKEQEPITPTKTIDKHKMI